MKILYSVQRYGQDIVGGSETACREFAENLVLRGHEVDVLTSCARSYEDWADHFSPGVEVINGVRVIRLPIEHVRDIEHFSSLHQEIMRDVKHATYAAQFEWLQAMGPVLNDQIKWLRAHAAEYDVVVFMTYLYATTALGLPAVVGLAPVVLQPTAHDEPPAHLPLYESLFHTPNAFLFLTEEEKQIVQRLYAIEPEGEVAGIGMDLAQAQKTGDAFRTAYSIGDNPYLLYVGRVDVFKGVSELLRFFVEYKGHRPGKLRLVLAGEKMMDLPEHEDITYVGFLNDEMKQSAIAGSIALVQSSPFESFSIVLCEAWLQQRPVLVQGRSEVMSGQVRRSEGGLPYNGFAEFEACLHLLFTNTELGNELGRNGKNYVVNRYSWNTVLDRFEATVEIAQQRFKEKANS